MRTIGLRGWSLSLFISGLAWISFFSYRIVSSDLQQDFSIFYSAGLSVREGYSPYDNNMDKDPRAWDGGDRIHSGFLYPPLAARFFVPLSYLPYAKAKLLWTIVILGCLMLSVAITTRLLWPGEGWERYLLVWGVAFWFFPTLYQVHNANIDCLILLLITVGFGLAYHFRNAWGHFAFGAFIACAAAIKLDTLLVLPGVFLLRWRAVLAGFVFGVAGLACGTLAIDGTTANREYLFEHFQRIYTYGEWAPGLLSDEKMQKASPGFPQVILKDGAKYGIGFQHFLGSASGTGVIIANARGHKTLILLLTPLLLWGLAYRAMGKGKGLDPTMAFYFFGLLIVLFCAPLTWIQRMVWVLPLLPWILRNLLDSVEQENRRWFMLCAFCMVLIGLPMLKIRGMGFYYCLPTFLLLLLLFRIQRSEGECAPRSTMGK